MICANCGSNVDEGIYCPVCGAQVEQSVEEGSEETTLLESMPVTEAVQAQDITSQDKEKKKKEKRALSPEEKKQRKKTITKLIVAGAFFLFAINMILIAVLVGFLALGNPANEIVDYLEAGDYYMASSLYENDMRGKPNKKLIKELDKRLDEISEDYQSGELYYDTASRELEVIKAMQIEDISEKLDGVIKNVETINASQIAFEDGKYNADYGYYSDAIACFRLVDSSSPDYETAQSEIERLSGLYKEDLFEDVNNDIESAYYKSAFEMLISAKEFLPEDKDIIEKLEECEATVVSEADKLIAELDYDGAVELISNAIEGYPESKTLAGKLDAIDKGRPTFLKDLKASLNSKNSEYEDGSFTDANNVEHDGKYLFDPGLDEAKTANAEFYLEKKYSRFNATFVPNQTTNEKEKFTIEILVDGKVVKTIKNFTIKSKNEAVEIDVTGASKLEIRVKSLDYAYYNYISMAEACVYK